MKESTYQITIGFLAFISVVLLVVSAFLLRRNRKTSSSSSRDSASFVLKVGSDSTDGDWN